MSVSAPRETGAEEYAYIGKPVPRIDGLAKVTGKATYAGDLSLPGMLHGKLLRSPLAHARIVRIDSSRAKRLPGVAAVITAADLPNRPVGFTKAYSDRTPLAIDKVRHVGEAIAAVAAVDEDTAEEALDLIDVEYEELPPVLSIAEALAPDAPLIHEHSPGNVAARSDFHFGDVEAAFAASDYVREDTFTTQRVSVGFIEPHAALASVDGAGRVTFQGSKQSPYITWRQLCYGLDLPLSQVRIINPYVGGAFSGKHDAHDLDFASVALARKTGRPVRIVVSQDEVLSFYRQRHAKDIWLRLGVKRDGTLTAVDCRLIAEGGGYLGVGPLNLYLAGTFMALPYRLPNIRYEGRRVYTNKPICGAVRGQSIVIIRYAFESLLDMVAEDIGVDRVDIRLRNAIEDNETTVNGMHVDTCGLTKCIENVAREIGWEESRRHRVPNRGIGMASGSIPSGVRLGGHSASGALVKVTEDGRATLVFGATELGQGTDTVMAQIVAEVLGLDYRDVQVAAEDSDMAVLDPGMFGDRCTYWTGNAVKLAAEDARTQLADIAARLLEVAPEDLRFRDRRIFPVDAPERGLDFLRVVREALYSEGKSIYGRGNWSSPNVVMPNFATGEGQLAHGYDFMAQAVEVEVDRETGKVRVLRSACADDAGQPLNPALVDGQLEGGTLFMQGQALYEECQFDERGRPVNGRFLDYKLPTVWEAPRYSSHHVITHDPYGPFGAKGMGEASATTTLGAIANAVYDAVGVRIKDLPITPDKIVKALREQQAANDHA